MVNGWRRPAAAGAGAGEEEQQRWRIIAKENLGALIVFGRVTTTLQSPVGSGLRWPQIAGVWFGSPAGV